MSVSEWSGRPDERESSETVAGVAAPGRTPVPADTEERDGRKALSGALRGAEFGDAAAALAEVLDPVAFNPAVKVENVGQSWDRYRRQEVAFEHAVNALRADWRLVSEDEATVDRVAAALAADDAIDWDYVQSSARGGSKWARNEAARFRSMARAAVRALREGQ